MVKLVRNVRVATHEAVNIGAHLRVVVLHVIVKHGDDDLRGSVLLELLRQGVDLGDWILESQALSGSGAELVGNILGNRTDERDRHSRRRGPQLVLSQVGSARSPRSHSFNVCCKVGEVRLNELRGV